MASCLNDFDIHRVNKDPFSPTFTQLHNPQLADLFGHRFLIPTGIDNHQSFCDAKLRYRICTKNHLCL